jgi:hypothetical protein
MISAVEEAMSNTIDEGKDPMMPPRAMSDCENFISNVYSLKAAPKNKKLGRYVTAARDALIRGDIQDLTWIQGEDNPADGLTRPYRRGNHRSKRLLRAAMFGRMQLPSTTQSGAFVRKKGKASIKKKTTWRHNPLSSRSREEQSSNIHSVEQTDKHRATNMQRT